MTDWKDLAPEGGLQLAVLGNPVAHSLSPAMQRAALKALGIEGNYRAINVVSDEFEACIAHLASIGYVGANVTLPHKEEAAKISAGDALVNRLAAANTLKFSDAGIEARNTDVAGFLSPISNLASSSALVLGAGGAAVAAVHTLASKNWNISIWNRSSARAEDIALKYRATVLDDPDPTGYSLIVNATPLGLKGEIPPLQWERLGKDAILYDLVYGLEPTPFLRKGMAHGVAVIDGREMLVEQGALALEWWLDLPAPREIMREAIGL